MGRLVLALFTVLLSARCALAAKPTNFTLKSYDVVLTLPATTSATPTADLSKSIAGSVTILLQCTTVATSITLDYGSTSLPNTFTTAELAVTGSTTDPGTYTAFPTTTTQNAAMNTITITPQDAATSPFVANSFYKISFPSLTIKLNTGMMGLFNRNYTTAANAQSFMVGSRFSPMNASEVIPGFDDPSLSVPMKIVVNYPAGTKVASSLNIVASATTTTSTTFGDGTQTLPLNNLAFFFGPSDILQKTSTSTLGSSLNFYYQPGYTTITNDVTFLTGLFSQVENLLGFKYPKTTDGLAIVFVPGLQMIYSGYGVIFIREDTYSADYSDASTEGTFRKRVVPVVAEFLKQFTQYSTRPSTWADSWMSQAITGYLLNNLLRSYAPQFDFQNELDVKARQIALTMDTPQSRPLMDPTIGTTIGTPSEAIDLALSDPIKMFKGAYLLSALNKLFPNDAVLNGIKSFLKNKVNSLVAIGDLTTEIGTSVMATNPSAGAQEFITNIATWINYSSYPLIEISTTNNPNSTTKGSIALTMSYYCGDLTCTSSQPLPPFIAPVTLASRSDSVTYADPQKSVFVSITAPTNTSLNVTDGDWVIANAHRSGYFRVMYSVKNWQTINTTVTNAVVSPDFFKFATAADQMTLDGKSQAMADAFALASSGQLNYSVPLSLVVSDMSNVNSRDWYVAQRGLYKIRDLLRGQQQYTVFQTFANNLLPSLMTAVQNTSLNATERNRTSALFYDLMCEFNMSDYRSTSIAAANTYLLKGLTVPGRPSISYDQVVCCAAQYDTALTEASLLAVLSDETASYYKKHYNAIALGCKANYTNNATVFTSLAGLDAKQNPFVMTTFQNMIEKHPAVFASQISTSAASFLPTLRVSQLASLIMMVGPKLNTKEQADSLSALSSSTSTLDTLIQFAATSATISANNNINWISARNSSLVTALADTKVPAAKSAADVVIVPLALVLAALFLSLRNIL